MSVNVKAERGQVKIFRLYVTFLNLQDLAVSLLTFYLWSMLENVIVT